MRQDLRRRWLRMKRHLRSCSVQETGAAPLARRLRGSTTRAGFRIEAAVRGLARGYEAAQQVPP